MVSELQALAQRWVEAAEARARYGGEDVASSVLKACARELEGELDATSPPGSDEGSSLGDGFVTTADVAKWIGGVSEATVRRWCRAKCFSDAWQLPNRKWRIPRTAALAYVETRKLATPTPKGKRRTRKYDRTEFVKRFSAKEEP